MMENRRARTAAGASNSWSEPANLSTQEVRNCNISDTLDTILLDQVLERRRHLIFGAASAPRTRQPLTREDHQRITQTELLNTIRDIHLLLLQQKAQLDDLRCQVAKAHGGLAKLQHTVQSKMQANILTSGLPERCVDASIDL